MLNIKKVSKLDFCRKFLHILFEQADDGPRYTEMLL